MKGLKAHCHCSISRLDKHIVFSFISTLSFELLQASNIKTTVDFIEPRLVAVLPVKLQQSSCGSSRSFLLFQNLNFHLQAEK